MSKFKVNFIFFESLPLVISIHLGQVFSALKQKPNGIVCYEFETNLCFYSKCRDSWNSVKSMAKTQASKEYIDRVTEIKQKNNIDNQTKQSSNTGPSVSRLLVQNDEYSSNTTEKTIYEFCQDGDIKLVEQLLKKNFDVNQPDETVLIIEDV